LFIPRFRKIVLVVFFLITSSFIPSSVFPEFFSDNYGMAHNVDVVVGESKVVTVSKPTRIAIGNPVVADVVGAGNTEIIISAKSEGETNLQIWDELGQRELVIRVFKEDLGKLKTRLEELFRTAGLRGVTFQVGDQERKVFVLGEMPTRQKELVNQLLGNFKEKIIDLVVYKEDNPVVEIDVQLIEIAKTAVDKLGIQWSSSLTLNELTPAAHTFNRQVGDAIKAIGQSRFDRTALTATINFLEQDNLARTLARPKLMALSGKEAKFLAGGQVPILSDVSVSGGSTTTSVQYVDYGIKLNIRPEVKENGDIVCQMEAEIKTIDTSTALTVQTGTSISTSTPGFKTRNVTTELYLKNNETVFMAGLIDNKESNNLQQVPAIGNLPIIGALFRSKDFQIGATELIVSITPRVLRYGDMKQDAQGANIPRRSADEDPAEAYSRAVQEIILKNVGYPLEAQRANLSGEAVLSLHLASSGQLLGVVVTQSSGHKLLDGAALYTVKRLTPYPSFPKDLMLREIWVEVPINYQLS
jgi:TonB family protein